MLTATQTKKCRVCSGTFAPFRPLQSVCGLTCARKVPVIDRKAAKAQNAKDKKRLSELDPKHQADLTQDVVNQYVRLRDFNLGCVSCDLPSTWDGQWHASHFRSRGAASGLRFHLWNNHKSCSICNHWKSGNAAEYEKRLRIRIGDTRVDWLQSQNKVTRYSVAYLTRLRAVMAKKCRRLIKAREYQ